MKRLEDELRLRLNDDEQVPYPDFGAMWERMEQPDQAGPERMMTHSVPFVRKRKMKRIAVAATLGALLAAAPVYAAIHYDWDTLLRWNSGVQSALEQNLGQELGQSITRDGVTLTLHTAVVDENQTVILYSLDIGKHNKEELWSFAGVSLKDKEGKVVDLEKGFQVWDDKSGRFTGYLQTDWTPSSGTAEVELSAHGLQAYSQQEKGLELDTGSPKLQETAISQDGLKSVAVQAFEQGEDKVLLASSVVFDRPETKDWAYPRIAVYRNGAEVRSLSGGTFGTPGEHGEYTMQQYFNRSDLTDGSVSYRLLYTKLEQSLDGPWTFDLKLSKKKMKSGTVIRTLNTPLEENSQLKKMVITPMQIRVAIENSGKLGIMPYQKYELLVGGKTLEGRLWSSEGRKPRTETFRFDRPADLVITPDTPIVLVCRYKVTSHSGGDTPVLLTGIGTQKQTLTTNISGYPVKWTYYKQNGNLYVESESESPVFGGVNQTYIGTGKNRKIGKPVTVNFIGDGNNKAIDMYKNFEGTEASVYMFFYSTDEPEREARVSLQP
ncbi:DUF4179 domain-containing protein [Paenibacillus rhizophilus]|uniref:DUF4179 domain-containing protein n=1 Tax=Paenibacillus rhizophilus TaxID=1850366 RepID=A0A3N9PZ51_9BACL|nr:DUF4179 domain-containing protein [Paenibacillus rhizophilus]RQW11692.1 DUF4179 domain-containing protein [Paenibacillus rhizophilus]